MLIEYVTHASLLLRARTYTLLTDPFFFLDPPVKEFICFFPPREVKPSHFGRLDFVFCSHIHDDHSHRRTLSSLKKKIGTVLLPAGKPELEKKIRGIGFKKIIFLENEKTADLGRGLTVTNFHDRNGVDSALVIQAEGKTILHQNDCPLDLETFRRMASRFSIDTHFTPHTYFQDLYPLLLPRSNAELKRLSEEREREGLKYIFDCLEILKPKTIIPYAYTVAYFNSDQLEKNGFGRTTPPMFCRAYRNKVRSPSPCLILQPGDVLDTETGNVTVGRKENLWGETIDKFVENLLRYAQKKVGSLSPPKKGNPHLLEKKLFQHFETRLKLPFPSEFGNQVIALHVVGDETTETYCVDPDERTFGKIGTKLPILEITLPAAVLKELLDRRYDPFMILYCYRITFKLNILLGLKPRQECDFYTLAVISLFDPSLRRQTI